MIPKQFYSTHRETLGIANSKSTSLSIWFTLLSNQFIRLGLDTVFRYIYKNNQNTVREIYFLE